MHKQIFIPLVFAALLCGHIPALAQNSEPSQKRSVETIPPVVLAGLQAYKERGPDEAIKAWIKGSPLEGSREALSQANNLRQVQDFYGAYVGYEVVSSKNLSPRVQIIYMVIDYEKGPLFSKFVTYRSDEGWIATNFNFNTKSEAIFPAEMGF